MNHLIRIVIADDESAIRNGLVHIVSNKQLGIEVVATADNGATALSLIRQHQPDIAIIDINMPEMDGLEVIRHAYENNYSTRFIILSGYNDFSYAQTAIRYGVKSYFLKPLNVMDFRAELSKQCQEIYANHYKKGELSTKRLSSLLASSRIHFLNQLIQNKINSTDEISANLNSHNLAISNEDICVLIFNRLNTTDKHLSSLSHINTAYIQSAFTHYPMESWQHTEHQIVAVMNITDLDSPSFRSLLQKCLDAIKYETASAFIVGIGTVVPTLTQCATSYLKAQEALSYHIYETETDIYDTSIIYDKKPIFSKENIDYKPIIQYITKNNILGIKDYCHSFFNSLFFVNTPPPNFMVGMCMYLIMNVQNQITQQFPDLKIEFEFTYEEISAFEHIYILEEWLINFFIGYSDILKDTADDQNAIVTTSKAFIHKNLHRNIKAKDVAAQVNLSESYFSIYFKDKTGINFRDYILNARIEYAKTLLQAKKESIGEIAYLTGYQDYRSFSRAFKNETGMSPSEYMNRH